MPGIFGAVSPASPQAAALPLEPVGERLRAQPGLRVRLLQSDDGRAVLGGVDLGLLPGSGVPYRDAGGSLAIVHGEIPSLGRAGDVAAAVLACARRDPAALAEFEGSFVAAIWDAAERRLVLVNYRFGLRNLYYASAGGCLVFAPLVAPLL